MKFAKLDNDGFVEAIVFSNVKPENSVLADDFDEMSAPDIWHKFHFDSKLWVDFKPLSEIEADIKNKRQLLLIKSDWTQLSDVPEATRLKWQAYRQALRDITLQDGFPQNIIWPEMPE